MTSRACAREESLSGLDLLVERKRARLRGTRRGRNGGEIRQRTVTQIHLVDFLARVDRGYLGTFGLQDRNRALVERTEDAMVNEHVTARHLHVKLHHRCAA